MALHEALGQCGSEGRPRRIRLAVLAAAALAVQAALAATAHGEQRIGVLVALYLVAAALWLALLAELRRPRKDWPWIVALAVGLRLMALGGPPWHETDM